MQDTKQDVETDSDSYHLWSSSSVDKLIALSVNGDNEIISDGPNKDCLYDRHAKSLLLVLDIIIIL